VERLEDENRRLQDEINIEHNMVGESAPMRSVYRFISRVAPSDATLLITGESGTGKELVARAMHTNSPRAGKPFVAINCAALTETLLESELFGHERGAFTGAVAQKKGKLEVGEGGTVFLDEMGELAPALQAKLLRVLQEREFERVGGTRPIHIDVRLIAATNRNLSESVKKGAFRQDLYYRLNVVSLEMPPLRERRDDIPLLAAYFASKAGERSKRHVRGISPQARACLTSYDWPGNVRELENAIERAVVLGSTEFILPEDLPEAVLEAEPPAGVSIARYHETVAGAKRQAILRAVEQAGGNYTEAAKLLGVHPNYLHRLIRNMNLRAELRGGAG
jgi:Nif-specific regulatory protein